MTKAISSLIVIILLTSTLWSQDYYYQKYAPFDPGIPSPPSFLGYDIGDYHSRHDRIVAYLEALAASSDRAHLIDYGRTHEGRRLVILQISTEQHLKQIDALRERHMRVVKTDEPLNAIGVGDLPVFVNLAYNVHGNEPSGSEAALLSAYVLVASHHPDIARYRDQAIVFVDPTINPDGRDRHTQWANSYRSEQLVSDPLDAEHNEMWPRGRTNHYWFDLNRDWLLAVHPESRGKLQWYHDWYPNVVTDFHEMGTRSTYFFEPMKANGSLDPIMPVENYTMLNDTFARYYQRAMDRLGSLYFTKEIFDGTYPGYGSSYPDLQGGLGVLFEQASSRGHIQETMMGDITFPYTIRNHFVNSIATVEAAVDHRDMLYKYQRDFFHSAKQNARRSGIKAYIIEESHDINRMRAFLDLLLLHQIEVYKMSSQLRVQGCTFDPEVSYVIPTEQAQYRMVQTMFETYDEYRDSVFYDASAWSLANAYNISYKPYTRGLTLGDRVQNADLNHEPNPIGTTDYAYIMSWEDYNAPAVLFYLQSQGVRTKVAQRPFTLPVQSGEKEFSYGSIVIPLQKQDMNREDLKKVLQYASAKWKVEITPVTTGYSLQGIDLGSRYITPLQQPKALILIGDGVSSYEAGFVWHLLDQRVNMPITKLQTRMFNRADLMRYNTLVLVSGRYPTLDSVDILKIKKWISKGNTLITIGRATEWVIKHQLVQEKLLKDSKIKNDSTQIKRHDYIDAPGIKGKESVGGSIFKIDLDITHPIGYGYHRRELPVYRNNKVWIQPSKNPFNNVAVYAEDPHIDGFITRENLDQYLSKSASIVVSRVGSGRAVLYAEDPNFRGTWYGTNKLFLNALFFGNIIRIP